MTNPINPNEWVTPDIQVGRLNPLQNAAYTLLRFTGLVVAVLAAFILGHWLLAAPPIPTTLNETTLSAYQTLSERHDQQHREAFQTVVASALLPIVTALVGYLFGVSQRS